MTGLSRLRRSLSLVILLSGTSHAMRSIMEGLQASNNTVLVDTTNAVVEVKSLNYAFSSLRNSNTAACTGSGHDDGPLLTALDRATSSYILVDSTSCFVNTNIALANTVIFSSRAVLNGSGNITLATVPIAAPQKIFGTSGSVTITQANDPIYAEWWGAYAYPTTTTSGSLNSATAFQSADSALTNGGTIKALTGHYRMNSTVTNSHANLIGEGRWNTIFEPGSALVAYSSMTMFSWNNHYAHYESFQVNGLAISTFTVFLSSNAAGGERVRDIEMVNVGIGFNIPVNNAAHFSDVFINGCSSGIYSGGNPGLFAGDIYFNDFTIVPYNNGYGWIADKNSSAFYITNLTVLGGIGGFWEALTSASLTGTDAKPSNMIFHHPLINAQSSFGLRIDAGLYTTMDDNPIINGISPGTAISVNPSTPTYVDGLEIDNALVNGNGTYGIDFAGCNLSVLGGNYYANTSVGIHIGAKACGLVKLQDLMAGTTIWANAANAQAYGVQLDAGALNNKTDPGGNVYTGRLVMTNLMLGGNATGPYQDNSTIADSRKLISNIQTDLAPSFSYGSNLTASVMTSSAAVQYQVFVGTLTPTSQTREKVHVYAGVDQNLSLGGAQSFAAGGTITSIKDNGTLTDFQLRSSRVSMSDGGLVVNGTSALASGDQFRVITGSATVDGMFHIGSAIVNNTCLGTASCTVTCTAGTYLVGGGCNTSGAGGIFSSFPTNATTWSCTDLSAIGNVVAYGICARIQ